MSGLRLFKVTSDPAFFNIASYHSRHSLTWSWVLSFSRDGQSEKRLWPLVSWLSDHIGQHGWLRLPWIGIFHWMRQWPTPRARAEGEE